MSTTKKLFKGSVLRSFILVANIAVGFFMMPFLIHSLGDEQYGIWILVGTVVGFYGLLDMGMGRAIVRFVVRALHDKSDEDVSIALSSSVFIFSGIGILSLIATLVIIFVIPYFVESQTNKILVQIMVAILGVKVSVLFPLSSFNGVLIAKYRFDILSYMQLFSLVFRTSLIVVFVHQGYEIITVAFITAADAIIVSLSTIFFAKKIVPGLRVSPSLVSGGKIKEYYKYGKYAYITAIADRVRFSIDDLVIAAYIGVASVTHYAIGVTIVRYFGEAMAGIFGVINPLLHKYHKLEQWGNLRETFFIATELTTMVSVLIGGLFILLGGPFIQLWMGEEYNDAYPVLVLLCISGVIANAQRPSVSVLFAIAKHKYYAKITSIEALANIAISIILVQYMGMYGVALGTVIPLLFNKVLLQPIYTCKQLGFSLKIYYFIFVKFFSLGASIFAMVFYLVELPLLDSYFSLMLVASVTSFVYLMIGVRYMVDDKTRYYIRSVLPEKVKFLVSAAWLILNAIVLRLAWSVILYGTSILNKRMPWHHAIHGVMDALALVTEKNINILYLMQYFFHYLYVVSSVSLIKDDANVKVTVVEWDGFDVSLSFQGIKFLALDDVGSNIFNVFDCYITVEYEQYLRWFGKGVKKIYLLYGVGSKNSYIKNIMIMLFF